MCSEVLDVSQSHGDEYCVWKQTLDRPREA